MHLFITVDTEADDLWSARSYSRLSTENLKYIPEFHRFCRSFGFSVTYLLSREVLSSRHFDLAVERVSCMGGVEWGAHFHPDLCEFEDKSRRGRPGHKLASQMSPIEFSSLLQSLTTEIEARTGSHPTSYRAGRYSIAATHVAVLERLGYKVDSSVTPNLSWQGTSNEIGPEAGMDFRTAPVAPYFLNHEDVARIGHSSILEVPVTILYIRHESIGRAVSRYACQNVPRRISTLLGLAPVWLRPLPYRSAATLIEVYEAAKGRGLPCVNLMIHSSELMPGGSPYWRTHESIRKLYSILTALFKHVALQKVTPTTLTEYANLRPQII